MPVALRMRAAAHRTPDAIVDVDVSQSLRAEDDRDPRVPGAEPDATPVERVVPDEPTDPDPSVPDRRPANDDDAERVREVPLSVPFEARQLAKERIEERNGPPPRRKAKMHTVYGIIDPRTGTIGYVGETVSLSRRRRYHVEWTWERVEDVVRPEIERAKATLVRLVDPERRARREREIVLLRDFLRATPRERVAIAMEGIAGEAMAKGSVLHGPSDRMPRSVRAWLAAMGEAGVEPRFVQLDRARGRVRVQIKETVWCHWLARSGLRLMNCNLDHSGHVAALRREHEALLVREAGEEAEEGAIPAFDEAAALRRLMAFADTDPQECATASETSQSGNERAAS